ncbi:MAG: hypothetical protein EOP04_22150 [Proteobacteria bacterium]|nr:MAG: hypothetical protein EOP04_22150 [Pseudomonadota bacterium]
MKVLLNFTPFNSIPSLPACGRQANRSIGKSAGVKQSILQFLSIINVIANRSIGNSGGVKQSLLQSICHPEPVEGLAHKLVFSPSLNLACLW